MITGSMLGNASAVLYLLVFQAAGIALIRFLLPDLGKISCLVIGSVAGNILLHHLPALFACCLSFGTGAHLAAIAVCFVCITVCLPAISVNRYHQGTKMQGSRLLRDNRWFACLSAGLMILWCFLLYTHVLRRGANGSVYTGQSDYGDLSMHLGFMSSIAVQKRFPPDYSIFPGVRVGYPILCDSISSSLMVVGAGARWAFVLPMILAFGQVMCSVYLLAKEAVRSAGKAALASMFFFLNGGFGFAYFINNRTAGGYRLSDIFTGFYTTPTNLLSESIRWVNVIADMLLPQRATLFGYAILFAAFFLLWRAMNSEGSLPIRYLISSAVFAGSLPIIHTHSFLAFILTGGSFFLAWLWRWAGWRRFSGAVFFFAFIGLMTGIRELLVHKLINEADLLPFAVACMGLVVLTGLILICSCAFSGRKKITSDVRKRENSLCLLGKWGVFFGIILILALPQLIGYTFRQVSDGHFVRGCFNWGNQEEHYIWFYIKNIGVVLLLFVPALIYRPEKRSVFLAAPIPVIWFLAELVAFAPNSYDNNKLLYAAYLFMCIIAADYAGELWEKKRRVKGTWLIALGVLFLAAFSALLTLGREVCSNLQLYEADQVALADWVLANTEPGDVILTSDRHNNAVSSLTGRNIVCGSDAFLFFHGIDTGERKEDVERMYEEPKESEALFKKYNVSWLCCSPYESASYGVSRELYDKQFRLAFESGSVRLYEVRFP